MVSNDSTASDTSSDGAGSIWLETTPCTDYEALSGGVEVDTAIVGGGIAGVSTAYELVEAGQSVAVLDRGRILEGVTGRTTAKLTSQHGLIYQHLVDHVGTEGARAYAEANEAAIDTVEARFGELGVVGEFARTPAFTYTTSADDRTRLREEADVARSLALPATFVESTPLPFDVAGAVRFDDQARFHPRAYLLALAREVPGDGGHVFERTRVTDVEDGEPCRVSTDGGDVLADDVVVASHFPIVDPAFYFARLTPKRSYVLAARLDGDVPEGMYYRSDDPYFSIRPHPADEEAMALFGGQNHRTGHGGNTTERYQRLEREARDRFDVTSVEYRWSTQDYVSVDRVPFVGPLAPTVDHLYVATGFGGWGLTNGTAAGGILADLVLGRENPWAAVFRPTRFRFTASAGTLIEHNAHAARHFVEDALGGPFADDLGGLPRDDARLVDVDGAPVGVYRDEDGAIHAVSAVCPHMGCHVEWNDAERSWDCPCHGSRFDYDGSVLDTPAVEGLERYDRGEFPSLSLGRET